MHAKVPLSLGVQLPLELLVLGIVGSAVRDDENRLQGTKRDGKVQKRGQKWQTVAFVESHTDKRDTEPSKVR